LRIRRRERTVQSTKLAWKRTRSMERRWVGSSNSNVECFKCGKYGHCAKDCYSNKCSSCGKVGHFAKDCWFGNGREETTNLVVKLQEEKVI